MCNYAGHEFGSAYPDSVCIDGFLWDADSHDGDVLTQGGEWACPRCNTSQMLSEVLQKAQTQVCGISLGRPYVGAVAWEDALRIARQENAEEAEAFLGGVASFVTHDWPDRRAVLEGRARWDVTIERRWPWKIR